MAVIHKHALYWSFALYRASCPTRSGKSTLIYSPRIPFAVGGISLLVTCSLLKLDYIDENVEVQLIECWCVVLLPVLHLTWDRHVVRYLLSIYPHLKEVYIYSAVGFTHVCTWRLCKGWVTWAVCAQTLDSWSVDNWGWPCLQIVLIAVWGQNVGMSAA